MLYLTLYYGIDPHTTHEHVLIHTHSDYGESRSSSVTDMSSAQTIMNKLFISLYTVQTVNNYYQYLRITFLFFTFFYYTRKVLHVLLLFPQKIKQRANLWIFNT